MTHVTTSIYIGHGPWMSVNKGESAHCESIMSIYFLDINIEYTKNRTNIYEC